MSSGSEVVGRRDDAAGRLVGERLEDDQGADDGLAVTSRVGTPGRPVGPERPGLLERRIDVDRRRRAQVRLHPAHGEGHPVAFGDHEAGAVGHVLSGEPDRRPQPDRVRAGHPDDGAIDLAHPGHDLAVAEPQPQHALHLDRAADTLDYPDEDGPVAVARRHEIDHPDHAAQSPPFGLQDQGVALIPPGHLAEMLPRDLCGGRRDQPVTMPLITEQCGEAGGGVEPRRAQPVGRAIPADQRGRAEPAHDRVVLDKSGHDALLVTAARRGSGRYLSPGQTSIPARPHWLINRPGTFRQLRCRRHGSRLMRDRPLAPPAAERAAPHVS